MSWPFHARSGQTRSLSCARLCSKAAFSASPAAAPAAWAARASLSSLLAGSAVRGGGGHGRWRRGMVIAQVALSLVLLSSGALVVRSFERLLRADPGFRPDGVRTVRLRT